jgi:xylan 1,4-beta-xylosidase
MRFLFLLSAVVMVVFGSCTVNKVTEPAIINPLNLSYRFRPETNELSRREAADPVVVVFQNEYFLFASKTGGYWHSVDLQNWQLVVTDDIPSEDYAPAALTMGDAIYFMASNGTKSNVYKSTNPKSGKWEVVCDSFPFPVVDPAFFLDDDQRLYFYWGCSNNSPLWGVELDNATFMPKSEPIALMAANTAQNGWEVPGDYNQLTEQAPWIEGAWMNKHNGLYYLQYSGPGTEYKSYADGVYTGNSPLGPFELAPLNPFAYKPEGFINGIGHGSTFTDKYGNYWHIGTMSISVKHPFERRLGLHPVFFIDDKHMVAYTAYGDYPMVLPQKKINSPEDIAIPYMLLSYNKPVQVSSQLVDHPAQNAVNEDARSYWSAQTGDKGEWLMVNLNGEYVVNCVQVNFAEHHTKLFGRQQECRYRYLLEYSADGEQWKVLSDKTLNTEDVPHDFIMLEVPVKAAFIRLTNIEFPDGKFAVSGLRVFGRGNGELPSAVKGFELVRHSDKRIAHLKWQHVKGATGYNISYGPSPDKMYLNYMVYGKNDLVLRSLSVNSSYSFKIEAFNENGISQPSSVLSVD